MSERGGSLDASSGHSPEQPGLGRLSALSARLLALHAQALSAHPAMPPREYPDDPAVDGQCPALEERLHTILDEAGVPREGLNLRARLAAALQVRLHRPGEPVPREQEAAKKAVLEHETWAAEHRRRWKARDDAEELWMRRGSFDNSERLLDLAGIPRGELSFNGRLAKALGIRFASAAQDAVPAKALSKDPVARARTLLNKLPRAPWPVASSGLSLDIGDVR